MIPGSTNEKVLKKKQKEVQMRCVLISGFHFGNWGLNPIGDPLKRHVEHISAAFQGDIERWVFTHPLSPLHIHH